MKRAVFRGGGAALLLVFGGLGACRKGGAPLSLGPVDDPTEHPAPEAVDAGPPPRCTTAPSTVGPLVDNGSVEVGAPVAIEGGVIVGGTRREGPRRVAMVLRMDAEGNVVKRIDVGAVAPDAPPPRVAAQGSRFFAVFQAVSVGDAGPRGVRLEVVSVDAAAATPAIRSEGSFPSAPDDSAGFDVRPTNDALLVTWDETPVGMIGSAIVLATVRSSDAGAGKATVLSPPSGDAEAPRLFARPGGSWLLWLATRIDEPEAGVGAYVEAPAEVRRDRWVEALALDENGQPRGAARAITSLRGHVRDFDAVALNGALHVLFHDEAEAREGLGGRIGRIVLRGPGAPGPADVLVPNDVGHATVDVLPVQGGGAWLSFLDVSDKPKLALLNPELGSVGVAAREPALDGARPLFAGASGRVVAIGEGRMGVPAGEVRTWPCRP